MNWTIVERTIAVLAVVGGAAVGFTAWEYAKYAHRDEVQASMSLLDAELRERILMAESTRYAEVAKYYTDKLQEGEALSEAEQARLELVQQQQQRIHETLKK